MSSLPNNKPTPASYHRQYEIRWADLDPNGHVRHSAYLDYAAQLRIAYFSEHRYPLKRIMGDAIGPVLFSENISYLRELSASELITTDLALTGLSENRKHWGIRHQVFKQSGELAASVDCCGAWMDLNARKVVVMSDELYEMMAGIERATDYELIGQRK